MIKGLPTLGLVPIIDRMAEVGTKPPTLKEDERCVGLILQNISTDDKALHPYLCWC